MHLCQAGHRLAWFRMLQPSGITPRMSPAEETGAEPANRWCRVKIEKRKLNRALPFGDSRVKQKRENNCLQSRSWQRSASSSEIFALLLRGTGEGTKNVLATSKGEVTSVNLSKPTRRSVTRPRAWTGIQQTHTIIQTVLGERASTKLNQLYSVRVVKASDQRKTSFFCE